MLPILTVFLSLQRRVHHEALWGPSHTWLELLWPREDVLPMVQKVLLEWAKMAILCHPRAYENAHLPFSPRRSVKETFAFLQKPQIFR